MKTYSAPVAVTNNVITETKSGTAIGVKAVGLPESQFVHIFNRI